MSMNTGNYAELLYPGLKGIWGDKYKDYPEEYTKFCEVKTSTKNYEKTLGLTGFGLAVETAEGSGVTYDDAYQGITKTYTHVYYTLGFIVTSIMYEDDQYGKINALPAALARSNRHTIEIVAANVLNRAFNSSYVGADGVELCSLLHPLVGGGYLANELTTAADLSMTSYEQMTHVINDFTDDRGLQIYAQRKKLIVAGENEWTAKQILGSSQDPETNYNAINPAQNDTSLVVNHYLTDADAWFIQTDVPNGVTFWWRRRPAFTKDNDFDTDNGRYKTTMRFVTGWDDPRNIAGSPGA